MKGPHDSQQSMPLSISEENHWWPNDSNSTLTFDTSYVENGIEHSQGPSVCAICHPFLVKCINSPFSTIIKTYDFWLACLRISTFRMVHTRQQNNSFSFLRYMRNYCSILSKPVLSRAYFTFPIRLKFLWNVFSVFFTMSLHMLACVPLVQIL